MNTAGAATARAGDHYRFRTVQETAKGKALKVTKRPPTKPSRKPWWQKDWDDPVRRLDRTLFA